jgi:hypothetical protein
MFDDREDASLARIEKVRRINRSAAVKCGQHGVTDEELAIAAAYSAFDLAERHAGPEMAAIEWMRTALDVLERAVMDGVRRRDAG